MSNCKKCNNHKIQQNHNGHQDMKPVPKQPKVEVIRVEASVSDKTEYIKIGIDEYAGLIASATHLRIIERWAKVHSDYDEIRFNELRLLLGVKEDK